MQTHEKCSVITLGTDSGCKDIQERVTPFRGRMAADNRYEQNFKLSVIAQLSRVALSKTTSWCLSSFIVQKEDNSSIGRH